MKCPWLGVVLLLFLCVPSGRAALCHGGWMQWRTSCYLFNNGPVSRTWSDSRIRCLDQDSDLLTIEDTHERDWILGQCNRFMRGRPPIHHWWTGLNAMPDGSSWQWPNSTSTDITMLNGKWAGGQPRKDRNHMCVEVRDVKFTVQACTNSYHAICERPVGKPLTCDPGWKLDSGKCYLYVNSNTDYNGARNWCHNHGATLAQIPDLTTEKAVWEQARSSSHSIWISLRSLQQGNSYKWIWEDGSTLTTGYWTKIPQSLGANMNKTCAEQTNGNTPLMSWNAIPCNQRRTFVCQKPQGTCPSGWLQFTNRCFNFYTQGGKSFNAAQTYCQGLGGDLAALDTWDIVQFLWPYVRDSRASGVYTMWIGLTDYNQDGGPWTWLAGNKTLGGWHNWPTPTVINTPGKQDCVTVDTSDPSLKWRPVASCGAPNRFACQMPVNKPLQHPTPPPKHYTCPRGFRLYQLLGTCMQLNQHDRTWADARRDCQQKKADLLTIPNGRFNNYIKSQIQAHLGKYWIGLHDRNNEGHFQWLDSTSRPSFLNWHTGQPSNGGSNENCVAIFPQDNFKWWDNNCANKYNYICQIPATLNGHSPLTTTTTHRPWSRKCGPLWEDDPNSNSCYMFSTDRLSWLDARDACHTYNGDLLSINSITEQFYINGRISGLHSNFFWVGANDRQTETGWRWTDNSPMAFINWKPHEPNNQGNSDCVGISNVDGRWSDFKCTDRYGYICEKQGTATTKPTPAVTSPVTVPSGKVWGCGRGWRGFNGQCYAFIQESRISWSTAKQRCGQRMATLVSIHSDAENKFVYSLVPNNYHGSAWIGLSDQVMEGSFAWSDMSPVTYTVWRPHEPNNLANEDCVAFYNSRFWNDFKCDTSGVGAYICKKSMGLQNAADIALAQGCSAGIGFRAQCYVYVSYPTRSWQAAQADCHRRHGNLATVNDRHIQAFVGAELLYRGSPYWIGLKNTGAVNNTYMWATNYTVDFTSWSQNHTGNEVGTCVAMASGRPVGLWQNFQCNHRLPYICEVPRRGFTTPPPTPPTTIPPVTCPQGWAAIRNLCVKAFNLTQSNRLSWMESRQYCQDLGGDLLSVRSKTIETSIISQVFNNITEGFWWIGLNDRDSENGHVWSDGQGVRYTNWFPGEPNDYNNREDCVVWLFKNNGQNGWYDFNCYLAGRFICYIYKGKQLITTPAPPTAVTNPACQNSTWLFLNGHCYYLSPESGPMARLNWYAAQRVCHSMNSELASVHSVDENGLLTSAMSRSRRWTFWLGLNDLGQDGYSWTDGTQVDFISWNQNEPNDAMGGESCVESDSAGAWNDENCMDPNSYICKQLPGGLTPPQPTLPLVSGGCPHGFTSAPFLEKCYQVAGLTNTTRLNFTDAITFCQGLEPPATLVSIHYRLEQRYLTSLIGRLPHFVWIGLNDRKRRNYFEWHDNSEVRFTHWGANQPDENLHSNNPADRRDCVAMNTSPRYAGNWNDMNCGVKNHFICQVQRNSHLATLQPENTGCKVGYTRQMNRCYKYYSIPKSWTQAQATCRNDHAVLATPTNRFQKDAVGLLRIRDRQHARNISDIWIGMVLSLDGRSFQWVNNWAVKYTSWATSEPDNSGKCVKMDSRFFWHDHLCNAAYPFVCQQGGPQPRKMTTVKGLCEPGWSPQGEYCYRLIYNSPRSWPGARYACQQLGSSLVSVHSKPEMDFLNSLVLAATSKGADSQGNVWLGLSKAADSGFAWSDGTELEFDYWDQGEPSDADSGQHQDCVQWSVQSGKWNDVDCFNENYYMCKKLQVVATTTASVTSTPTPQPGTARPNTSWGPNTPGPGQNPSGGQNTPGGQKTSAGQNTFRPSMTQRQTGINNNGGGSNGGLSGGAVAGIVIGALAVVVLAGIFGLILWGRLPRLGSLQNNAPGPSGNEGVRGGFENALYTKNGPSADADKGSISFGTRDEQSES